VPAGPHAKDKAAFADALAFLLADAVERGEPVQVPDHLKNLFDFLFPHPAEPRDGDGAEEGEAEEEDGPPVLPPTIPGLSPVDLGPVPMPAGAWPTAPAQPADADPWAAGSWGSEPWAADPWGDADRDPS
jgi:putative ATP-dependent endonuclease of OLD family